MYSIGIDIGGTNLPVGIIALETQKVISKRSTPFVKGMSAPEAMDKLAALAREQMDMLGISMDEIAYVGIGVPGVVMPDKGYLVRANNLEWYEQDIGRLLSDRLDGKKVYVENDANAAAWGEHIAGACRGTKTSVVLTIGTGLGAGVIINDKMLWGSHYNAGELGHVIVEVENGIPCSCGNSGCIERYTAATAIIRWGREALQNGEETMLREKCGGDPDKIDAKMVIDCSRENDPVCQVIFQKFVHYLAVMCLNIVNFLDPEVIAIGGGVSNAGEYLMIPLRKELGELIVNKGMAYSELRICQLEGDAGLLGAGLLGVGSEQGM
ncbi:MAG: ROK family protein [Clostridia bacterium]|nr:ROK family protein [Clostridia bacterium]